MIDDSLRLVKIPIEIWKVSLRVEPNRPLAEAEALILTLANEVENLDRLVTTFPGNDFPWSILVGLEEQNLIRISEDGSLVIRDELSKVIGTSELLVKIREGGLAYKTEQDVVRDLVHGNFHHPGVLQGLDESELAQLTDIQHMDSRISEAKPDDLPEYDSENLIVPISGRIKIEARGKDIVKRTRIQAVTEVVKGVADVALRYHIGDDGWARIRPHANFEDSSLLSLARGVYPPEPVATTAHSWKAPPEFQILKRCNEIRTGKYQNLDLLRELKNSVEDAIYEINNGNELRANQIVVESGTEYHQRELIKKLISGTKSHCVVLSSFLNRDFADDVAGLLNESVPSKANLLLLYGHPEDIGLSDANANANEYYKTLEKNGSFSNVILRPTKNRTHAKIAINDRGLCWVGTYNLLSGAPGSDTTEIGVLIQSSVLAKKLVEKLTDWDKDNHYLEELRSLIDSNEKTTYLLGSVKSREIIQVAEEIFRTKIGNHDGIESINFREYINERPHLKSDKDGTPTSLERQLSVYYSTKLSKIEKFFTTVSERPQIRLVATDEHRNLLLDLVNESKKCILLGSDRIKPHGFDLVLMRLLSMSKTPPYEIRIIWAREDGYNYKLNDDIKSARKLLKKFKQDSRLKDTKETQKLFDDFNRQKYHSRGKSAKPVPPLKVIMTSFDTPMGSHAKLAQVDDKRLLITSDNMLAYGDTSYRSDSRELGILIDSPRHSLLLRGELELTHHQIRATWPLWNIQHISRQNMRWAVALADSLRKVATNNSAPAGTVINDMLNRCIDSKTGERFEIWQDLENVRGPKKSNERFMYELIWVARKMGLIHFVGKDYYAVNEGRGLVEKLSALELSLPSPNHIWEKAPS